MSGFERGPEKPTPEIQRIPETQEGPELGIVNDAELDRMEEEDEVEKRRQERIKDIIGENEEPTKH